MKKITVITVCYNSATTIAETLRSVRQQRYGNIEHIVVDGGSNDDTLRILAAEGGHLTQLISERDGGLYDAMNKGIQMATGDIIGFLHSDDLFFDDDVLIRISAAFSISDADAVYGDLFYVSKVNPDVVVRYWKAGEFSRDSLSWGWMPPHPTFYVRRSVYQRLGIFDLRYRISADYDTVLRFLGMAKIRVKYVPGVMVRMRIGGTSNRSFSNIMRKSKEDYLALRRNGVGGVGTLVCKNFRKLKQFFCVKRA